MVYLLKYMSLSVHISETVADRIMKLAHRPGIASTTIKLIKKIVIVHFINFIKNNSADYSTAYIDT